MSGTLLSFNVITKRAHHPGIPANALFYRGGADALVFLQGSPQDDRGYGKIGALVEHLFTLALGETLVVLVPGTAYILSNSKKIAKLQNLKDAGDQDVCICNC